MSQNNNNFITNIHENNIIVYFTFSSHSVKFDILPMGSLDLNYRYFIIEIKELVQSTNLMIQNNCTYLIDTLLFCPITISSKHLIYFCQTILPIIKS